MTDLISYLWEACPLVATVWSSQVLTLPANPPHSVDKLSSVKEQIYPKRQRGTAMKLKPTDKGIFLIFSRAVFLSLAKSLARPWATSFPDQSSDLLLLLLLPLMLSRTAPYWPHLTWLFTDLKSEFWFIMDQMNVVPKVDNNGFKESNFTFKGSRNEFWRKNSMDLFLFAGSFRLPSKQSSNIL